MRKGEKACPVIYYGQATPKQPNLGEVISNESGDASRSYLFLRLFYVFNVDQIDELPKGFGAETIVAPAAPGAIEQ